VGTALPADVHRQAAHGGETTRAIEAPTFIDPEAETRVPFHENPEARLYYRPHEFEIAEGSRTSGNVDRDLAIELEATRDRTAADLERIQERMPRLQERVGELETRIGELNTRIGELREELDVAHAQAKDTDRLQERIEGLEERIARREEALQSVRDRIASVPVLERRIKEIDSLLRTIMVPILQARIGERQAELDSLNARVADLEQNARVNRTLKQQQFIDELQT